VGPGPMSPSTSDFRAGVLCSTLNLAADDLDWLLDETHSPSARDLRLRAVICVWRRLGQPEGILPHGPRAGSQPQEDSTWPLQRLRNITAKRWMTARHHRLVRRQECRFRTLDPGAVGFDIRRKCLFVTHGRDSA